MRSNNKSKKRLRCKRKPISSRIKNRSKKIGGWDINDPDFLKIKIKNLLDFDTEILKGLKVWVTNLKINFEKILENRKILNKQFTQKATIENSNKKNNETLKLFEVLDNTNNDDYINKLKKLLKELPEELLQDNHDYSLPKYTYINQNITLLRRQPTEKLAPDEEYNTSTTAIWLDYSSYYKRSFLKDKIDEISEISKTRLDRIAAYFGKYLFTVKPKKKLLIFHFPDNISSYFEGFARKNCIDFQINYCNTYDMDGYTFDILSYNPNNIFKDLPSLGGYREICVFDYNNLQVLNVSENIYTD